MYSVICLFILVRYKFIFFFFARANLPYLGKFLMQLTHVPPPEANEIACFWLGFTCSIYWTSWFRMFYIKFCKGWERCRNFSHSWHSTAVRLMFWILKARDIIKTISWHLLTDNSCFLAVREKACVWEIGMWIPKYIANAQSSRMTLNWKQLWPNSLPTNCFYESCIHTNAICMQSRRMTHILFRKPFWLKLWEEKVVASSGAHQEVQNRYVSREGAE